MHYLFENIAYQGRHQFCTGNLRKAVHNPNKFNNKPVLETLIVPEGITTLA